MTGALNASARVAVYSRVSTITGAESIPVIRPQLCEDRLSLRWVLADNDNDMRPVLAPFVLEARRRGLLKVATAYLIVTWLVLEIGHTLFLIFDLPHGALQFIFVLLALGFPMMLVAVWHGWLGASASPTEGPPGEVHVSAPHEGPWLAVVFGAVALFVIAVAISVRFFGMGSSGASHPAPSQAAASHQVTTTPATAPAVIPPAFNPPAHSIAVLPFVNMSGDPQQEYFSDGMAEELLNSLVRISELKVAAPTSASFKAKDMEVGDIARKLNVGAILQGSVRKSGEQVRINVKLVNAVNGYHLWSQTYDRGLDNIFEVQADIATNVVRQLQATLLGSPASPKHAPAPRRTPPTAGKILGRAPELRQGDPLLRTGAAAGRALR